MLGDKIKSGSSGTTLVSRGTEIIGDIKFTGTLDIEGIVRGSIVAHAGSEALVRIIDKGLVEGDVHAPNIVINGAIVGNVHSSKHLELASKARVEGNVHYTLVEMAIGAQINGSLEHTPEGTAATGSSETNAASASSDAAHEQVPRLATASIDN
ncbi:MAG: cytoskeletal protein CcmA (bactofilin family) [Halieaceae bacterium]|jgi:cytoskeletal protein CcmA (bactofilin family)